MSAPVCQLVAVEAAKFTAKCGRTAKRHTTKTPTPASVDMTGWASRTTCPLCKGQATLL